MPKTAFLGVAHIHTPNFIKRIKERPDWQVMGVYDHDAARAKKRADELGCDVRSFDELARDPEIGSVIICSETARHLDLVEAACASGKHLFVEKPLAINGEQAERMARMIENENVTFQTGFFQRSSPQMQFIKREIASGHLGTITRMRHTNCHHGALGGWFDDEWRWIAERTEAGGGGFADLGAHSLDIILWCLRGVCGEVQKVSAALGTATNRYGDIDEYGAGLLTFSLGAIAEVEASWVDPKLRSAVEVHGTQGQIQVIDGHVYYFSDNVEGADGSIWDNLPAAKPHAFDLFLDAIEGKPADLVSPAEAAEEARLMHEMYRAAGR